MKHGTTLLISSGICLLAVSSHAIDLSDGLMAHLPLNNSAADITGNGYDGTVYGAVPSSDRFGNPNGAYSFDGLDDYIELSSIGGFKTVSLWVRQDTRSEFDFYFGHHDYRFYARDDGDLILGDDNAQRVYTSVDMDSLVGQWVHVAGVSDGSQSKVYLNGVNVTTTAGTLAPVLNDVATLGVYQWSASLDLHFLNGAMDDVRVYDRALSDIEVAALHAIPEPATMSMIALFAGGMYFVRRFFPTV